MVPNHQNKKLEVYVCQYSSKKEAPRINSVPSRQLHKSLTSQECEGGEERQLPLTSHTPTASYHSAVLLNLAADTLEGTPSRRLTLPSYVCWVRGSLTSSPGPEVYPSGCLPGAITRLLLRSQNFPFFTSILSSALQVFNIIPY